MTACSIVELYIKNGLDVHHKVGRCFNTLVHNLSTEKIPSLLKVVILAGADVNAKDRYGDTPLHCAVKDKNTVELLLAYNAHYDIKNNEGLTPYDIAQDSEVKEILKDEESVNKAIVLYAQTDG